MTAYAQPDTELEVQGEYEIETTKTVENGLIIYDPKTAVQETAKKRAIIQSLQSNSVLIEGHDYATIPGTGKPSLMKPGAERLCSAFSLKPKFIPVNRVEDWEKGFFHVEYECILVHIGTNLEIATSIASCNTKEARYRWRWVSEEDVPHDVDKATLKTRESREQIFKFAYEKRETTGQYGKPESYYQMWDEAIKAGLAREIEIPSRSGKAYPGYEMGAKEYRIENDDTYTLHNTIIKMAQKRALVAAVLIASNASEFFTQDIEDNPESFVASYLVDTVSGSTSSAPPPVPTVPNGNGASSTPKPFAASVFLDTEQGRDEMRKWLGENGVETTAASTKPLLIILGVDRFGDLVVESRPDFYSKLEEAHKVVYGYAPEWYKHVRAIDALHYLCQEQLAEDMSLREMHQLGNATVGKPESWSDYGSMFQALKAIKTAFDGNAKPDTRTDEKPAPAPEADSDKGLDHAVIKVKLEQQYGLTIADALKLINQPGLGKFKTEDAFVNAVGTKVIAEGLPVYGSGVRYVERGNQKYMEFVDTPVAIRCYGMSDKLGALGFDEATINAVKDGSKLHIDRLHIQYESKGSATNTYYSVTELARA